MSRLLVRVHLDSAPVNGRNASAAALTAASLSVTMADTMAQRRNRISSPPRKAPLSTGCFPLDAILHHGGLPLGSITEIFGEPGAGKTTLGLHIVAEAQRRGVNAAIVDAEFALDADYAAALGVDVEAAAVIRTRTGDDAVRVLLELTAERAVHCILIDSVSALLPAVDESRSLSEVDGASHPSLVLRGLHQLRNRIEEHNIVMVLTNQLRQRLSAYGKPETTSGGRSVLLRSDIRVRLRPTGGGDVRRNEGLEVIAEVCKDSGQPPWPRTRFTIRHGRGIDDSSLIARTALELCRTPTSPDQPPLPAERPEDFQRILAADAQLRRRWRRYLVRSLRAPLGVEASA